METTHVEAANAVEVDIQNPLEADQYSQLYIKPCIKVGSITFVIAFFLAFLPPLVLWLVHGVIPSFAQMLVIIALVCSSAVAWWIVEPISYFPTLGTAGSYMAFMVGGISSVRLPCAIAAQEATDAEPGSQKGEIMATLGIAGSVVTNLVFVTLGVVGGTVLLSSLPPAASTAFKYVPVAIYGTLFSNLLRKRPDLALFGVALTLFLVKIGVLFIPAFLLMVINVVACAAFGLFLYKKYGKK